MHCTREYKLNFEFGSSYVNWIEWAEKMSMDNFQLVSLEHTKGRESALSRLCLQIYWLPNCYSVVLYFLYTMSFRFFLFVYGWMKFALASDSGFPIRSSNVDHFLTTSILSGYFYVLQLLYHNRSHQNLYLLDPNLKTNQKTLWKLAFGHYKNGSTMLA